MSIANGFSYQFADKEAAKINILAASLLKL